MIITGAMIDRAARYLRETQGAGKRLTPWATTLASTKRKWLRLAEGTLRAAQGTEAGTAETGTGSVHDGPVTK